jgi:class 3 adenylate cyclase/tetratricopeptide (TPR) repeat protein
VLTCHACGEENPERAKFCLACGAPLEDAAAPAREVRKTVTVVFTDLAGSTAMGEQLDPETLRRVMDRYFDRMREVIEAHGGTVEKYIGDAIMAVFGIPTLHEDDAVRAVRAAAGMREALEGLNDELERDRGVRLAVRTGVNTGEVVTGDAAGGQRLVTGDAVNVAARLEQAAGSNEILLGESTYRLVRDAVEVELIAPVTAKGKADPLAAYRLVSVAAHGEGVARHLDSPMVGRKRERSLLADAFNRAVDERTCSLFTVLGSAGVGKSRLVGEFLDEVAGRARILHGRCLPYGEGITYWPLRDVISAAAGITDDDSPDAAVERLRATAGDGAGTIADDVAALLGLLDRPVKPEEGFRAVRRLLEHLGRETPLVVVFDDIHWAEGAMLDLIEHIADWSRDAPILLLCVARPDLLEQRPGWGGGKMNATSILLQPLSPDECRDLIANLLGGIGLDAATLGRVVDAAEGNPLFVEQMVAVMVDDGILERQGSGWAVVGDVGAVPVPASIQALLSARLDRLGSEERAVIESASVVGRVFYRTAVAELAPADLRTGVGSHLLSLVRKELIRPDAAQFADEDTFRFLHMLIRDAAYESMPKATRAELHERFAEWLHRAAGNREREFEEIVAYHLEEAYRYRSELGTADAETEALRGRAVGLLYAAGQRAASRTDVRATANFLGRAIALAREDEAPPEWLLDYGQALMRSGDVTGARPVLDRALDRAEALGDDALAEWTRAILASHRTATDPEASTFETLQVILRAIPLLEAAGHRERLADALALAGWHEFWLCRAESSMTWFERALQEALSLNDRARADEARGALCSAMLFGGTPLSQAIPRLEALRRETVGRGVEGLVIAGLAIAAASSGDFEEARRLHTISMDSARDFGDQFVLEGGHSFGALETMARNFQAIVDRLEAGVRRLEAMGHTAFAATTAGYVAEAHAELGNLDQAQAAAEQTRGWSSPDDISAQMQWRRAMALVNARRGEMTEATRLAAEATELTRGIDYLDQCAQTFRTQSEVADLAGDRELAMRAARTALEFVERRENVVLQDQIRDWIAELESRPA